MYYKGSIIGRVLAKARREALHLPLLRSLDAETYLHALEDHSVRLPSLDFRDLTTLECLRSEGVRVLPIAELQLPESADMLSGVRVITEELRRKTVAQDNAPRSNSASLASTPEIYLWGLNERLLDLAENYIQLPVRFYGVNVRREIADGSVNDVRQWHMDPDDRRMVRIIVYVDDVLPGGGPFEYIAKGRSREGARQLRYTSGFVSDERIERVIARVEWKEVLGPAGSTVIADTSRVFHRAQAPRLADRYSVTFTWKSTTPRKVYPPEKLPTSTYAYICSRLNSRQLAALMPN